ncbi:PEP-utilizing enzyme, partial [Thermosynechococcus sp.]
IPILAATPHIEVARRLQLVWGVEPLLTLDHPSLRQSFQAAINAAQERGFLEEGDLVVMTAGTLQGVSGSTDMIKVELVTSVMGRGCGIGHGSVSGPARVVREGMPVRTFNSGEILVAERTSAELVEAIRKAAGIITEEDSLTSHAAVLGLRLGIPVIVGVKNATRLIREGTILTMDVERGLVYSGARNGVERSPE